MKQCDVEFVLYPGQLKVVVGLHIQGAQHFGDDGLCSGSGFLGLVLKDPEGTLFSSACRARLTAESNGKLS